MINKCVLSFILSIIVTLANAQTKDNYTIKGTLIDSITSAPIAYATVRLYHNNNPKEIIACSVANEKGIFNLIIHKKADYLIQFSSIGKGNIVKYISFGNNKDLDMGIIQMSDKEHTLKGVVIAAKRPIISYDMKKMVYHVQDDPDVHKETLFNILRKMPIITVNDNDEVSIAGSTKIKVLLNGKEDVTLNRHLKDVLKNIPAEELDSYEVITNPNAKYSQEGYNAVLNIVTVSKKKFKGYNTTIREQITNYGTNTSSAFATFQSGKLTVSISGKEHDLYHEPYESSSNYIENFTCNPLRYTNSVTNENKHNRSRSYGDEIDASYELDKLNLFNSSFSYNTDKKKEWPITNYNVQNINNANVYGYTSKGYNMNGNNDINFLINYQHTFKSNHNSILTLSYMYDKKDEKANSIEEYQDLINQDSISKYIGVMNNLRYNLPKSTKEHTAQTDFSSTWGYHTVNIGINISIEVKTVKLIIRAVP